MTTTDGEKQKEGMSRASFLRQHFCFRLRFNAVTDGFRNLWPVRFVRNFLSAWHMGWALKYRGPKWTVRSHMCHAIQIAWDYSKM